MLPNSGERRKSPHKTKSKSRRTSTLAPTPTPMTAATRPVATTTQHRRGQSSADFSHLNAGFSVVDDYSVREVGGHDEIVFHDERRLLRVKDEALDQLGARNALGEAKIMRHQTKDGRENAKRRTKKGISQGAGKTVRETRGKGVQKT